jgi:anaerobic ribonucleoside-triphosphate reductase activating protein
MKYHDITKDDMKNGDGLRVVLWLAGCDHACPGCQNPITWDPEGGLEFDAAAKEELFEILERSYISGITFSGGDPLFHGNRQEVGELIGEIRQKFPDKTIWLYTGYTWEEIIDLPYLDSIDVVVDGPYVEAQRDVTLCWKGSLNQRVIDVKATLRKGKEASPVIHCPDHWYSREEKYVNYKGACCGENS